MSLVGELFVADVLGKPVLDPTGEEIGRLRDIAVVGGGPFPRGGAPAGEEEGRAVPPLEDLSIFNRRIISSQKGIRIGVFALPDQLLIGKDLLDKQIVDIDGAKVVRVNDVKLAEEGGMRALRTWTWGSAGSCAGSEWSGGGRPSSGRSATRCATR